ncbi:uncharacterized protein BO66DRAFT_319114 [Aspergillus aculeatinus CBS 121060]|uniref:Uncharacterized protein n=1 Tax=Aspergillus aculeatinus CBS 121060 TaxID=1448322 RepID=A0ACD1HE90_9EURO|nr:hypothetical protein BO66DRAFT_319114 [Aspergillus aculeatinus CBS 121060]RAH71725.1 hypothetical protein BO66DRAFT_319114 [Aspergillus aculeatinus CBS 121060]
MPPHDPLADRLAAIPEAYRDVFTRLVSSALHPELNVNRRRKAPVTGTSTSTKKRSSTDAQLDVIDVDAEDDHHDNDKENRSSRGGRSSVNKNCDEVRQEIRDFLDARQMQPGQFQRLIGVSAKSYRDFVGHSGPEKGARSVTFVKAGEFFRGFEEGRRKRAKTATAATAGKGRGSRAADGNSEYDVSGIELEDEEDEELEVPVFETCDRVRDMIRKHVAKPRVTKAGFLRDAAKAAFPGGEKTINPGLLQVSLKQEGALVGNTGIVFYAAYVFFEKLRIKNGEPKDDFRLTMEEIWPFGIEREKPVNGPWIVATGSQPYINEFGQLRVLRNCYP